MRSIETPSSQAASPAASRRANLAAIFQEPLLVVARLRVSRRSDETDAASFRHRVRELLKNSEQKGRQAGYSDIAVEQCVLALVAFIDETVQSLNQPIFADWHGRPLAEERYGMHVLGEVFYERLQNLLNQDLNEELADVLEVFYLCLLLGYKGRYHGSSGVRLNLLCSDLRGRIYRVRQTTMGISPHWMLPREGVPSPAGNRGLVLLAATALVIAVLLFVGFRMSLSSSIGEIDAAITAAGGQN